MIGHINERQGRCEEPAEEGVSSALRAPLERAREWDRTATPAEKAAMFQLQRESWARAEAPCEHGHPFWDECPKCFPSRAQSGAAS